MMWYIIIVQFLHVLCGMFWLGGTLYLNFVVIPTISGLPLAAQRLASQRLQQISSRVIEPAAILVILLGLVRGIVLGPVRSLDFVLSTAYGWTFLLAFLATVATYLWGKFVLSREAEKLSQEPVDEALLAEGKMPTNYAARLQRVKTFALLELLGFFIVLCTMILMRFGL